MHTHIPLPFCSCLFAVCYLNGNIIIFVDSLCIRSFIHSFSHIRAYTLVCIYSHHLQHSIIHSSCLKKYLYFFLRSYSHVVYVILLYTHYYYYYYYSHFLKYFLIPICYQYYFHLSPLPLSRILSFCALSFFHSIVKLFSL